MLYSLLSEINKKTMDAYVTNRVYDALYWPTFFPTSFTPTMKYEILSGIKGNRVMAEVSAFNSPAPQKTRQTLAKLEGDIPPILVKRIMDENDINKYNMLKAIASSDAQRQIMEMVFGDIDFCIDALNARLEWLCLQALSRGQVSLTSSNSAGIVTTDNIDFQIPDDNKNVESAAAKYWTTAAYATNDPIADIETVVGEADSAGVKLQFILMNKTKWQAFKASTAVGKFAGNFAIVAASLQRAPSLDMVNEALTKEGLPQIAIIDTRVSFENKDHTITSVDPWLDASGADRYVTFIPDKQVGKTYYGPIAEETNPPKQVTQTKSGIFLISKYSDVDPIAEYTKGQVNAFPGIGAANSIWILDTESHTTFGG